jgi:hypothetical protein
MMRLQQLNGQEQHSLGVKADLTSLPELRHLASRQGSSIVSGTLIAAMRVASGNFSLKALFGQKNAPLPLCGCDSEDRYSENKSSLEHLESCGQVGVVK